MNNLKKVSSVFYGRYWRYGDASSATTIIAKAKPVSIPGYEAIDACIHRDGTFYYITDGITGMQIAVESSVKKVIEKARLSIARINGLPEYYKKIQTVVDQYGITGRYEVTTKKGVERIENQSANVILPKAIVRKPGMMYYIDGQGNVVETSMNRKGGKKGRHVCKAEAK